MLSLAWLIPITLALGAAGLGAYIWSVRSGQYDDLDAAAWRILGDEDAPGAAAPPVAGPPPYADVAEARQPDSSAQPGARSRR
jgi:cbb3-type cytochrome oxidase maturation protein